MYVRRTMTHHSSHHSKHAPASTHRHTTHFATHTRVRQALKAEKHGQVGALFHSFARAFVPLDRTLILGRRAEAEKVSVGSIDALSESKLNTVLAPEEARRPPRMRSHDIIPALAHMLETEDVDIRKECAWAISNATSGGDDVQIKFLVDAGCVPPFVNLLDKPDVRLVSVALQGIQNIVKCGQRNQCKEVGMVRDHPATNCCCSEKRSSCSFVYVFSIHDPRCRERCGHS
jgi:hypothetical protein